jgi:hypothetical protein
MFISSFFRKVDAFLRNERPYDEWFDAGPNLRKFEPDLFDEERDPWYTTVYYAVYRFFKYSTFGSVRRMYREVKWFIQRGKRGWADCDTWSIDYYLNGWMPDALRYLKKNKCGIPMSVFPTGPEYTKDCGNPTEEASEIAARNWDEILDKMIGGFEASQRILDGLYEKELGEYPLSRPAGVSRDAWEKVKDDRFAASRLLQERDEKLFEEGMALFAKHYHSLWD